MLFPAPSEYFVPEYLDPTQCTLHTPLPLQDTSLISQTEQSLLSLGPYHAFPFTVLYRTQSKFLLGVLEQTWTLYSDPNSNPVYHYLLDALYKLPM